jgi:hypothetical protein
MVDPKSPPLAAHGAGADGERLGIDKELKKVVDAIVSAVEKRKYQA